MAEIHSLYPDDLLTNKQAAEYAGVAESTIRQWDRRGLLAKAIPARDRKNPNLYAKPDIDAAKKRLAESQAARAA
ncbi:MerR family transcriptional regulator [Streptomyces niveus]|uniref:MerR family transcriptional regulator n=1 Tax=Streptomyces niveus TaxID=193462 RepID=UPI0036D2AFF0